MYELHHELPKVAQRLKTYDLRKLGNFKKIPDMFLTNDKVLRPPSKRQILTVVLQNCEKPAVKHSIGKPMLLNLVDFTTRFFPRLQF